MFKNLNTAALGISGRQSEIIELALSHGFKGIDLELAELQEQIRTHGLPHARRLLDSAKLKSGSFRLPCVWDEDEDRYKRDAAALPAAAELAASLGCTRCVTTIAPANDLRPYHENFEFHRRRLGEIGELLAPHKIRLGVEFHASAADFQGRAYQFIRTFEPFALLIGMIRAPNVGLAWDLWTWQVTGGTLDEIRKLGRDRIVTVAIADAGRDSEGEPREETRLLPAESGVIDSAAALTALAEMGYDGPVTPVPHPRRFQGMGREAIVRLTRQQLDAAWTAAGLSPAGKLSSATAKK